MCIYVNSRQTYACKSWGYTKSVPWIVKRFYSQIFRNPELKTGIKVPTGRHFSFEIHPSTSCFLFSQRSASHTFKRGYYTTPNLIWVSWLIGAYSYMIYWNFTTYHEKYWNFHYEIWPLSIWDASISEWIAPIKLLWLV